MFSPDHGTRTGPTVVVDVARTRAQRARGLLGLDDYAGIMVFPHTRQVHTFGMRFVIDVVWCDRAGRVLRTRTMPPGRVSAWVPRSHTVLEARAGRFCDIESALGPHLRL